MTENEINLFAMLLAYAKIHHDDSWLTLLERLAKQLNISPTEDEEDKVISLANTAFKETKWES